MPLKSPVETETSGAFQGFTSSNSQQKKIKTCLAQHSKLTKHNAYPSSHRATLSAPTRAVATAERIRGRVDAQHVIPWSGTREEVRGGWRALGES